MILPLEITFRNMEPSETAAEWVREEADKLDTFYNRIMSCRVVVEIPHRHRRRGNLYHVAVDLVVPGSELVVKHEPSLQGSIRQTGEPKNEKHLEVKAPHKQLRLAINDAFKAVGRRLEDYVRHQRGAVKAHELPPRARVSKLLPEEGYGFLETPEGREIYFHKDSVLHGGFDRLGIGTLVSFVEEQGEKGPQASTVRITHKRRTPRAKEATTGKVIK
jgi:cold shock CspA family protein/ribosome-associated translation inhibitor RaiA